MLRSLLGDLLAFRDNPSGPIFKLQALNFFYWSTFEMDR